jgi:hypothetical protein
MAEKAAKKTKTSRAGQQPANRPKGWGGPAKGTGKVIPAYRFKQAGPGRGNYSIAGEGRLERQARHAEEMRGLYYEFANNETLAVESRMTAATHLLNRTEGLPVQKIVSAETDPITLMSDAELEADAQKQRDLIKKYEDDRAAEAGQG